MKKKEIVIDLLCAQPFGVSKFHGAGEYTKAVFKKIMEIYDANNSNISVCYNYDLFLDEWLLELIGKLGNNNIFDVKSYRSIVDIVNRKAQTGTVIFYAGLANQYTNLSFAENVYPIGTCHGLRQIEKQFDKTAFLYSKSLKDYLRNIRDFVFLKRDKQRIFREYGSFLKKFETIVTVSNHSKYSILLNFHDVLEGKELFTCYTPSKVSDIEVEIKDNNYIMMVSADRWIKNGYRGLIALDNLFGKGMLKGVDAVVYGGVSDCIKKRIKNIDRFHFHGYADNEELENAYSHCSLFFYPTLNEGFGMPPAEAQKYGKTCVISGVSSLPEIYEDSVYYCNPYDILEMESRLLEAFTNKKDSATILAHLKKLNIKQEHDLDKIARIILGIGE